MPSRRHYPAPPNHLADKKEASFQAKVNRLATVNGWRVDISDFAKDSRDPRFFGHLEDIAPKGKVRKLLEFIFGRRSMIFTFGYHTHTSINSQKGFPDGVYVHPRTGKVIFAELKRDTEYPSLEQRLWYAALKCVEDNARGAVLVRIWRPRDWSDIVATFGGIDPYEA